MYLEIEGRLGVTKRSVFANSAKRQKEGVGVREAFLHNGPNLTKPFVVGVRGLQYQRQ